RRGWPRPGAPQARATAQPAPPPSSRRPAPRAVRRQGSRARWATACTARRARSPAAAPAPPPRPRVPRPTTWRASTPSTPAGWRRPPAPRLAPARAAPAARRGPATAATSLGTR
ncbi:unnamed protein product, partial [Prorocentrum cordatum]